MLPSTTDYVFHPLQESFFWVVLERGFLVLQGRQAGRELRVQSVEKVSLFVRWLKRFLNSLFLFHFQAFVLTLSVPSQDVNFSVKVGNKLSVHYGKKQITADHIRSKYLSYYIGGLPAWLRERYQAISQSGFSSSEEPFLLFSKHGCF